MPRFKLEIGLSGIRVELHPTIKDFRDPAQSFTQEFQIREALRLTPTQLYLFGLYFAGYYAQKVVADAAYSYRQPMMEQARGYPLVGRLVHFGANFVEKSEEIGQKLMAAGRNTEKFMRTKADLTLHQHLTSTREGWQATINSMMSEEASSGAAKELNALLLTPIGRPDGIGNAANHLSTLYIRLEDSSQPEKEEARALIEKVIERFASSPPWGVPADQPAAGT